MANPVDTAPYNHYGELPKCVDCNTPTNQKNGAGDRQGDPHVATLCVPSTQFVHRIS